MRKKCVKRKCVMIILFSIVIVALWTMKAVSGSFDRVGTQWSPYIEWSFENPSFTGNPFDLMATVTFVHRDSGESRATAMFYDGDNSWKFRFTGTRCGIWTFTTSSNDLDLDGKIGTVTIEPNPGVHGFLTNFGNKWGRLGTDKAFVPQYVMYDGPHIYYKNPGRIDVDIKTFLVEHGFTGFHVPVFCRWFDINKDRCAAVNSPNPDPRTFEALELLITKVHAVGGNVHLWVWGDDQRTMTPRKWGLNGTEDRRVQRYIAARLGPLPGWSMGYGFDLDEWVVADDLRKWHDYMHKHFGWFHFLGGRGSPNELSQIYVELDYSSYDQRKPNYSNYVETIDARPTKPSFSEDRFRIRGYSKDYTMEETRRGLWQSTMAGGVANIWGNLLDGAAGANLGFGASSPYPKPEWIKTNSEFFENRFIKDVVRCKNLTDGMCLKRPSNKHYIFYKENASSIQMDLQGMAGARRAIAVDAKKQYAEIDLGMLSATNHTWTAPYQSDWAVAVGYFPEADDTPSTLCTASENPAPMTGKENTRLRGGLE